MPDDDARRVGALRPRRRAAGRARPARARAWVVIASPVRRAARATARWTRSSCGRQPRLVRADLADDARPDAGLPHPVGRLSDQLVGEVVDRPPIDARLGRVVGAAVPATAHDDVQAARRRDRPRATAGSRPDAGRRQVDDRAAARGPEARELLEDQRLVAGQLPVVPAVGDVPQRDLRVLVRQRHPEVGGVDRAEDGLDVGHGQRCYALTPAPGASSRVTGIVRSSTTGRASRSAPMFHRWGAFVYRFRRPVAIIAVVVAVASSFLAAQASSR